MESGRVFFLLLCIVAVISILWRVNLAINHPEKYERLRDYEREQSERRNRVVNAGLGLLSKFIKR
jgi:hypothetical protein